MTQKRADVVQALSTYNGRYEYDAVEYALNNQAEITSHLIERLSYTLENASKLAEDEGFMGHLYSVFLLAHFKEVKAHSLIVQLFSLPVDVCEKLFDDVITQELPTLLLRTCGGDFGQIRSLAEAILDLSPEEEHLKLLKNAFKEGQVPSNAFDDRDIEASLDLGPAGCLARI